jgi:tetratricopeptide (TPR) repeat protein
MKRIIIIISFLFVCLNNYAAGSVRQREIWNKANELYAAQDFKGALDEYVTIEREGFKSKELYYNTANCYFKLKNYGSAVLYYERALKFNPADRDIQRNLEITKDYTLDKIESVPEFILRTWIRDIDYSTSADTWAKASLMFVIIMFGLLLSFRFASSAGARKLSLAGVFVMLFLALSSIGFAWSQISAFNKKDSAIVMKTVASVKSSPDSGGKDVFMLHEGTKVKVIDEIAPWKRIVLSDGRDGWISSDNIEII